MNTITRMKNEGDDHIPPYRDWNSVISCQVQLKLPGTRGQTLTNHHHMALAWETNKIFDRDRDHIAWDWLLMLSLPSTRTRPRLLQKTCQIIRGCLQEFFQYFVWNWSWFYLIGTLLFQSINVVSACFIGITVLATYNDL